MTISTVITSTFLTGIQQQKALLKNAINTGAEAAQVIVGYIQFLQANSQYTAVSDLSEYTNISAANVQSVIDVLKSIYRIEGQEVARIVQNNPSLQYQAGSMLYQAAYNLALVVQGIQDVTTTPSSGPGVPIKMVNAYSVQEAMEATEATYTFIKTFVTNYQLTSQIDAYFLQLSNLGDVNQSTFAVTNVKTALQNFLVSLQQNLNTLQSMANSNTNNPINASNVSGFSPSTIPTNTSGNHTMWWIAGGVVVLAALYFMFGRSSQVVVVPRHDRRQQDEQQFVSARTQVSAPRAN